MGISSERGPTLNPWNCCGFTKVEKKDRASLARGRGSDYKKGVLKARGASPWGKVPPWVCVKGSYALPFHIAREGEKTMSRSTRRSSPHRSAPVTVESAPAPVESAPAPAPAPAPVESAPAPAPVESAPAPAPVESAPAPAPVESAPAPVESAPAPAPVESAPAPVESAPAPAPAPAPVESAPAPVESAPAPAPVESAPAPAPVEIQGLEIKIARYSQTVNGIEAIRKGCGASRDALEVLSELGISGDTDPAIIGQAIVMLAKSAPTRNGAAAVKRAAALSQVGFAVR
jgi:hypothetical protein